MTEEKKPRVIEYPKLKTINLSDPEIQKDLVAKGMAIEVEGVLIFTHFVELVAGGGKNENA